MSTTNVAKLSNRNKWCYSIGGLRDCLYMLVSTFLLVYVQYTMSLTNAQFAAIGIIMALCKVWDAINDPMMGTIIENSRLKGGKFRPWILIGALTNAVVTLSLFTVRITSGWGFVVFFGIMYLLWGMTFTMNDVGFWSMLPALSNNSDERNSLTTSMAVFCSIGAFAVAAVVPMVTGTDKVVAYRNSAIVVCLVYVLTQLLTFFGVKENEREPLKPEDKVSLVKMFKIIKGNDQLLWITLVLCFYYLASGMLLQFGTNFCYFEFGYAAGGGVYTVFAVVYLVATLISQLLFPILSKRLKRAKVLLIGASIAVLGYVVLMMFGYVLPKTRVFICISAFLVFFGQNLLYLAILVQMTNTIEYNELKTGSRNESIVFSLRSFLAKLTGALQTVIVTVVLITSGLKQSTDKIAGMEEELGKGLIDSGTVTSGAENIIASTPDSARLILRIWMVALPIVLLIITYFVGKAKYTITEEKYDEIIKQLDERKANELEVDNGMQNK